MREQKGRPVGLGWENSLSYPMRWWITRLHANFTLTRFILNTKNNELNSLYREMFKTNHDRLGFLASVQHAVFFMISNF